MGYKLKKNRNGVLLSGKRKKDENCINNGEKGLKNASFGVINSKIFRKGILLSGKRKKGKGLKNASFLVINSKKNSQGSAVGEKEKEGKLHKQQAP